MRIGWIGLVALIGCGGPVDVDEGEAPTFHKDVRPVLERSCVRCHDGEGVGPFPLTTYAEVSAQAALVADAVETRRMPPWLAGDGCNTYEDDWSLSQSEIDAITAWSAAGAPEGDVKDAPPAPALPEPGLPRVDYTLELPEPYVPEALEDDYRCFVLDWPDPALVTAVTGYTMLPGDSRTVHHVIAYIIPPTYADDYAALDGADGRPGYSCFGGVGGPAPSRGVDDEDGTRWLGGWAPGGMGGAFPEGTGIPVQADSKIVIQVHYHPVPGEPDRADQSAVQIMVDPTITADNWALIIPFADPDWVDFPDTMTIPAGESGVSHSVRMEMDEGFLVHTANLHMHTKGRSARLGIDRAGGEQTCLLDIPRWDFEWQRPYRLSEPTLVQPGDSLALDCTWDNDTSETVGWGDGTNDEMCLGTMYVTSP